MVVVSTLKREASYFVSGQVVTSKDSDSLSVRTELIAGQVSEILDMQIRVSGGMGLKKVDRRTFNTGRTAT